MKTYYILTPMLLPILFCQTILAQSLNKVDSLINQLHNPVDKQVMVTAHRGDWRNAPENSLPAYQRAIDMGVSCIEVDLLNTLLS